MEITNHSVHIESTPAVIPLYTYSPDEMASDSAGETTADTLLQTTEETTVAGTTNMPVVEVIEKSGLGIIGIFIVTGLIILSICLLNRLTSKKKPSGKDDEAQK